MASQSPQIVITDPRYAQFLDELAVKFPQLTLTCPAEDQEVRDLASPHVTGLVTQFAQVDGAVLDAFPGLQVVLKNGRSYHNIDMEAVRSRGLTCACVPRKGPNCVAELAMTLILALSKDLLISHAAVAEGAYRLRGLKPERTAERKIAFHWMRHTGVHEVVGKTLGIVGMGEIGCELARRARVMGMEIIYYKRTPLAPELEQRFTTTYADLESLLASSDYVCLALPHTADSEQMIGREQLARMKESAFLVNIARGGIVDEAALVEALAAHKIAGAGLDVFEYEPLAADSPLCSLDNVILTPHIGGGTGTTWVHEMSEALAEMDRILSGGSPQIDLS